MRNQPTQRPSYDPKFIRALFDEMSATYGTMNLITSFGFSHRWRKQCVAAAAVRRGERVLDLMTGMGELLGDLYKRVGEDGRIVAVDLSPRMCEKARQHQPAEKPQTVSVVEADALDPNIAVPDGAFDVVVSTFGLKTFSPEQIRVLARRIHAALRPGGRVSMLKISVPPRSTLVGRLLHGPYMFYLRLIIPLLGKLLLGNPDNYRYLGIYTLAFGNCDDACVAFREAGLDVVPRSYFFGCATGIIGSKPTLPGESR